jgi:hypothetical protein
MSFFFKYKNEEQEGKTDSIGRVGTNGKGEDIRKGCWRLNAV